ncbi:MAG: tripartite tricarboxylate transporter TctB family protein [Hyphomicrobiales bacterium]
MSKLLPPEENAGRDHVSRPARYQDLIVGVVILVVAGLLYRETFSFPSVNWTPLGLAFWPRIVLGGIAAACLLLIVLRQLGDQPVFEVRMRESFLFVALAGFIIALPLAGFFLTSTAYVFATAVWLGDGTQNRVMRAALISIATSVVVYVAFSLGLGVRLPQGSLIGWALGELAQ